MSEAMKLFHRIVKGIEEGSPIVPDREPHTAPEHEWVLENLRTAKASETSGSNKGNQ